MAVIREHLASKGLGLHCDLQNEHAIVGNNVALLLMLHYGSARQRQEWVDDLAAGRRHFAFGITEPEHGSDATFMETRAARVRGDGEVGGQWVINGEKTWNTGVHTASHDLIFARTSGMPGSGAGITAFLVPVDAADFTVKEYLWTFNMPTDHAHVSLTGVRVPDTAMLGGEGRGLQVAQHFFNENRIRQAAALRAHLPSPPPVPHHRGRRGNPDAAGGRLHVRLYEAAGSQGRTRDAVGAGRYTASLVAHFAEYGSSPKIDACVCI